MFNFKKAQLLTFPILLLFSVIANAQLTRLLGPDNDESWTFFGESVAIQGNYAAVGQPARYTLDGFTERVHIYKRNLNRWELKQSIRISGDHPQRASYIGGRIALTDRWLAFSQASGDRRKVHLFEMVVDTFLFRQSVDVPAPFNNDEIVNTIALTNEHLIYGGTSVADSRDGEVFFFRFQNNNWEKIQEIESNTWGFGNATAIQGNTAVIGSGDGNGVNVMEFDGNQWNNIQSLKPSDTGTRHKLGSNVLIHDDIIVARDFGFFHTSPEDYDAAYVFKKQSNGNSEEIQKIISPTGESHPGFGDSFAHSEEFLFIGESNRLYKYQRTDSTYNLIKFYGGGGRLGKSVALSGNTLMIGQPQHDVLRGAVNFGFVDENLFPVSECMLPMDIHGININENNFGDLFNSTDPTAPPSFGVASIDQYFLHDPVVYLCFTETERAIEMDFIGFDLLENPNMQITWEGDFMMDGQSFTAEDVLDDIHKLKPKLLLPLSQAMKFKINIGRKNEAPCETYAVRALISDFHCTNDTLQIDIAAGDTIQLDPPCNINPVAEFVFYEWYPFSTDIISDTRVANPFVYPIDTTIFQLEISGGNDSGCEARTWIQVNPFIGDLDDDGFLNTVDCDDQNPTINPDAIEIVQNGIDENCDGIDEDFCHNRQPDAFRGKDAMVRDGNQEVINYSLARSLNIGANRDNNITRIIRSFIDFDLRSIPPNAIIESAFLTLHYNPDDPFEEEDTHLGVRDFLIQRVVEPWEEDELRWISQPTATDSNEVLVLTDRSNGSNTRDVADIEVTQLVADMISTDKRFGFSMKMQEESRTRQLLFASSNHPDKTLRPELNICWKIDSSSVATNELSDFSDLKLAPNPAFNFIEINNFGAADLGFIYSLSGKKETSIRLPKGVSKHDISQFISGIYFLKTRTGQVVKFVKI